MKREKIEKISKAIFDVSRHDITFEHDAFHAGEDLCERVSQVIEKENGFAVICGAGALLARHGLALEENKEKVFALYEEIFRKAMSHIDMDRYNVTKRAIELNHMDVDGYNINKQFSHDGKVVGREYMTTKCIHFDTATPFVANIYGPNINVAGGYPVITEIQQYCADRGVEPRHLVTNIPQNYNTAIKEEYYDDLIKKYSFCLKMDFENDMVMIALSNEVEFGVAHGATDPLKVDPSKTAFRPIRHYEYQYFEEEHYAEWLSYYNIQQSEVTDYDGTVKLSLDYYRKGAEIKNVFEYQS